MAYEVRVLKTVSTFIDEAETKARARMYWVIDLLRDMGPFLGEPYSKKLQGNKGLYELRVQSGNLRYRLFYFHSGKAIYIVTSGFMKQQQKTPRREITRAMELMRQYREENHG